MEDDDQRLVDEQCSDEKESGWREDGRACGEGREVIINLEEVERADVCPLFRGLACNTRRTKRGNPY